MVRGGLFPRAKRARAAGLGRALALVAAFAVAGCGGGQQPKVSNDGLTAVADNTLASGDLGTALQLYRQAATRKDASVQDLTRYGSVLLRAGQYDFAAGAFIEALSRQPGNREAQTGLGVAQMADGRLEEAENSLEQVVRSRADARSIRNLAVLRLLQGQAEEARLLQQKALGKWPLDLDLKSNFGLSEALDAQCPNGLRLTREAMASPFARAQNVALYALVLAICGNEQEAGNVARSVMSEAGLASLLAQAAQARQEDGVTARVQAIGIVPAVASGVLAPDAKLRRAIVGEEPVADQSLRR